MSVLINMSVKVVLNKYRIIQLHGMGANVLVFVHHMSLIILVNCALSDEL